MRRSSEPTDEYPPERIDAILTARNVGGKVPLDVFDRITRDILKVTRRQRRWTCATYRAMELHHLCPHHGGE